MSPTSDSSSASSGGIGLSGAVFLVFLILRLTHYIDWSWWWITAPLWGPLAFVTAILMLVVAAVFIKRVVTH